MDHHAVTDIDTDVGCTRSVVGSLEKDQVTRFCGGSGDNGTDTFQAIGRQSAHTPAIAAVIDDIGHEAGTVKAGGRTASAPDISSPFS